METCAGFGYQLPVGHADSSKQYPALRAGCRKGRVMNARMGKVRSELAATTLDMRSSLALNGVAPLNLKIVAPASMYRLQIAVLEQVHV